MEKKGFKDGPRTYYYHTPFSYKDFLLIIVFIIILVVAYFLALHLPITGINDVRIKIYINDYLIISKIHYYQLRKDKTKTKPLCLIFYMSIT